MAAAPTTSSWSRGGRQEGVSCTNHTYTLGTWAYSYGFTASAGLGEYAKRVIEGSAERNNLADLVAAYGKWTPTAKWNAVLYTDANTGVCVKNLAMVYMDCYVFGGIKGEHYLVTTGIKMPEEYYAIKKP